MSTTQPVIVFDLDREVRTVEAMAARLTPYIYEDELYGAMPGDLPRLTIGSFLMRLHRLEKLEDLLSPPQMMVVQDASRALDKIRKEWGVAYEGKLQRELKVRLTAINTFISECRDNPGACGDTYPSAIEKRVMAQELADEAEARGVVNTPLQQGLMNTDNNLRRFAGKGGHFVWDHRLEAVYPPDRYWYLYAK